MQIKGYGVVFSKDCSCIGEIALGRHNPTPEFLYRSRLDQPHSVLNIRFWDLTYGINELEVKKFINNIISHGGHCKKVGKLHYEIRLVGGGSAEETALVNLVVPSWGLFVWDNPGALITIWETDSAFNRGLDLAGIPYDTYIPEGMAGCCYNRHTAVAVTERDLKLSG